MKWIVIVIIVALGMLVLAFMTPNEATGDLLSLSSAAGAFSEGSFIEHLRSLTPGRVIVVTGNTGARLLAEGVSTATGVFSPLTGKIRDPKETATEIAEDAASSLLPESKKEQETELIESLQEGIAELESTDSASTTAALAAELDGIVTELKNLQEEQSFLQSLFDKAKEVVSSEEDTPCECSLEAP